MRRLAALFGLALLVTGFSQARANRPAAAAKGIQALGERAHAIVKKAGLLWAQRQALHHTIDQAVRTGTITEYNVYFPALKIHTVPDMAHEHPQAELGLENGVVRWWGGKGDHFEVAPVRSGPYANGEHVVESVVSGGWESTRIRRRADERTVRVVPRSGPGPLLTPFKNTLIGSGRRGEEL